MATLDFLATTFMALVFFFWFYVETQLQVKPHSEDFGYQNNHNDATQVSKFK